MNGTKICVAVICVDHDGKKTCFVKEGRKQQWVFVGGKVADGETDAECLVRAFREKLPNFVLDAEKLDFYEKFFGTTKHTKKHIRAKVYLYRANGECGITRVSREVSWATYRGAQRLRLSAVTKRVLKKLKKDREL